MRSVVRLAIATPSWPPHVTVTMWEVLLLPWVAMAEGELLLGWVTSFLCREGWVVPASLHMALPWQCIGVMDYTCSDWDWAVL